MEILQNLISFILKEFGNDSFKPLIESFINNGFNLKALLSDLSIEKIAPIISAILNNNKNNFSSSPVGLTPIANVADKEIIYTLNKYLSN